MSWRPPGTGSCGSRPADNFGGPYAAVYANAVLLHLSRAELSVALGKVGEPWLLVLCRAPTQ